MSHRRVVRIGHVVLGTRGDFKRISDIISDDNGKSLRFYRKSQSIDYLDVDTVLACVELLLLDFSFEASFSDFVDSLYQNVDE